MKEIFIKEQSIQLLPEKAIFWKQTRTLILADIHLGKAATFRSHGIPVPEGCMQEDLNQLAHLLDKYQPKTCIIAGDLIHAQKGLTFSTIEFFRQFLEKTKTEFHLVLGNHDRALKKVLPEGWHFHCHEEKYVQIPFVFKHYPGPDPLGYVWSGHIHPCTAIKYAGKVYKLPCFIIGEEVGILPAFTSFAAGKAIRRTKGNNYYPITDNQIFDFNP